MRRHVYAVLVLVTIWAVATAALLVYHVRQTGPVIERTPQPAGHSAAAAGLGETPLDCPSGTYPSDSGCQPLVSPTAATGRPELITHLTIPGATVTYYEITGSTGNEILEQIQEHGPGMDPDPVTTGPGVAAFSLGRSTFRITSNGDCQAPVITLRQTVVAPLLRPGPAGLSDQNVRAWNYWMQIIALHEGRHVYINWSTVRDFGPDGPDRLTCVGGKAAGKAEREALMKRNADYHAALRADCVPEAGCPLPWAGS